MFHLSERLGKGVLDSKGQIVGRLADVIVPPDSDVAHGLVVKTTALGTLMLPFSLVAALDAQGLHLSAPLGAWPQPEAREGEVWLAREVLDRRVVDAARARLARVNSVIMEEVPSGWRVVGVDVGARGLLVRLGIAGLADALHLPHLVIPWEDVGLTRGHTDRLEQMHPAEIAAIVHELPPAQGSDLVEALPDEVAADTLEEVHPDRQADLLEDMAPERAADILEEMAPDEAADVLQDMTEEKAQELLGLMEDEEAADAKELLAHDEDSAGGIMTTEYATLPLEMSAGEAMADLRRRYTGELDDFHYAYVTDADERVLGVVSVWGLVMAEPGDRLESIMETKVVSVTPDVPAKEAARLVSKYGLLAIPVVSADNRLLGVVTIDDAMDLIAPDDWRGRLPDMY